MKQYNNKYKNVFYNNRNLRLYDETKTNSFDALYSETQIKLIELIEKHEFKVFYFLCKPLTDNKLIVNEGVVDLNHKDIKMIKKNQMNDFYFFYENKICEVFYSFLKVDDSKNYYFDFMLVVNKNFNLNKVYDYKFKSVSIISVKEVFLSEITFEFIEKIYEQRLETYNNAAPIHDNDCYDLDSISYNFEKYVNEYHNGLYNFSLDQYNNFDSFYFYSLFDQNECVKKYFSLLCSHVWSFDRIYYIEKNKYGLRVTYKEKYEMNSLFLTNFAELVGCISVDLKNENKIKQEYYTYSSLIDNHLDQGIFLISYSNIYLKSKKIDFSNLEIINVCE